MNIQEAKEILSLYRPGTADAEDEFFCEARQLCEQEPELKAWFENHCEVYTALRSKLRTAVPEGLKDQILAEQKVVPLPVWRRPAFLAAAAPVLVLAGIAAMLLFSPRDSAMA